METVDQARAFLAGHTYEWRDESGNDNGVPTLVWHVSFNDDASQCNVVSRPVTQDGWTRDDWEENAMDVQRYINSGNAYVSIDCKATRYDMHIEDGALVVSSADQSASWQASRID